MPHVTIKHFPVPLDQQRKSELVAALTDAVTSAFGCEEGVVSIALEPVPQDDWSDRVYVPEIVNRRHLLCKAPSY
jgi:4-oxalocrotonate tautomerase